MRGKIKRTVFHGLESWEKENENCGKFIHFEDLSNNTNTVGLKTKTNMNSEA